MRGKDHAVSKFAKSFVLAFAAHDADAGFGAAVAAAADVATATLWRVVWWRLRCETSFHSPKDMTRSDRNLELALPSHFFPSLLP